MTSTTPVDDPPRGDAPGRPADEASAPGRAAPARTALVSTRTLALLMPEPAPPLGPGERLRIRLSLRRRLLWARLLFRLGWTFRARLMLVGLRQRARLAWLRIRHPRVLGRTAVWRRARPPVEPSGTQPPGLTPS